MTKLSQVGLAFVCLGLVAPAAARADSVSVMNAVYETSFIRAAIDHEQATPAPSQTQMSIFSWCRRCSTADASPFLVSTNLSAVPSDHQDVNVVFNGGFMVSFGGAMTLPVPAISAIAPGSSAPTVTLPIAPAKDDDHHGADADHDSGGGAVIPHGHDADHDGDHKVDHVVAGVTSTGHGAISKAESVAATPEPATLLLLGTGLIGIVSSRKLRAKH